MSGFLGSAFFWGSVSIPPAQTTPFIISGNEFQQLELVVLITEFVEQFLLLCSLFLEQQFDAFEFIEQFVEFGSV